MTTDDAVRIITGAILLLSLFMSSISNGVSLGEPTWLWLALLVSSQLFQSGFTRFCWIEAALIKLGMKPDDPKNYSGEDFKQNR